MDPLKIKARTVSGDFTVRAGSIGELHATTTSGDLRVSGRFDGNGPFAIETVSGDGTLAPVNDVRVEAKTITGDIDSDRPSRREDTAWPSGPDRRRGRSDHHVPVDVRRPPDRRRDQAHAGDHSDSGRPARARRAA